ncbi:hypothetical protein SAMN05444678_104155 [Sphingomonas sp. YR710]|jgi:uncharacterized protein (DUF2062 family)|uniref:DUF2062 domain-containing protein n=1 Tax=Sphingomonas sp. YR710 TaxID=1882773 RepID=UPI0008817178|nr:DUF2062 domain-containing protein [Sphingomonas sp. YR710]SDC63151.1 hypothetical protein SAMN05444678_104155 [Sphingomonas sp. YR710]
MTTRLGDWWRRNAPTRESIERIGWLRPVAHRILEPSLWRFTRRSVPRGVALGIIVGIFLMIPGIQMGGAALLALPCRANVPVAVVMTFLSNPITTPFILYSSILVGSRFMGAAVDAGTMARMIDEGAALGEWGNWLASTAAPSLVLGLFVIATIAASIGYLLAGLVWRVRIGRKWAQRTRDRVITPGA